jgi:hypothetical protein
VPPALPALPARLSLRADASLTRVPFPYGAVRARLDRAWSDPTPLGGVARSESHAAPGASAVEAAPGLLAFLGREHRFLDLGPDVAPLLDAALAGDTASALEVFGADHRAVAARCLATALKAGLLVPA